MTKESQLLLLGRRGNFDTKLVFSVDTDLSSVLQKLDEVFMGMDRLLRRNRFGCEEAQSDLPGWFLMQFAEERTQKEEEKFVEKWRSLAPDKRKQLDESRAWDLSSWIHWLEPEMRIWTSLHAVPSRDSMIEFTITSDDLPVPLGFFKWMLRSVGAAAFEEL